MKDRIQQLIKEIRQDSSALFELRQLLFGVVIIIALLYGVKALYLEPKQKENNKHSSQLQQLAGTGGGTELEILLSGQLKKLQETRTQLEDKISRLAFKEKILREQFASASDESFTNAVFSLLPQSPVDLNEASFQMKMLPPDSFDFFDVKPMRIKGRLDFPELIAYLEYLEERQEVGMIGDIVLELPTKTTMGTNDKIQFDLKVGRVQLH